MGQAGMMWGKMDTGCRRAGRGRRRPLPDPFLQPPLPLSPPQRHRAFRGAFMSAVTDPSLYVSQAPSVCQLQSPLSAKETSHRVEEDGTEGRADVQAATVCCQYSLPWQGGQSGAKPPPALGLSPPPWQEEQKASKPCSTPGI